MVMEASMLVIAKNMCLANTPSHYKFMDIYEYENLRSFGLHFDVCAI